MKIVQRQRPEKREAPDAAGPHPLSINCPTCKTLLQITERGGGAHDDGDADVCDRCAVCGGPIEGRGSGAIYCSHRCSGRAYRRRQRGVPQDAFPNGGSRGAVPLNELTRAEMRAVAKTFAIERPR